MSALGHSKRRILWVNHFAVSPDVGGGTRHFELGKELVGLGWKVTIAASDFHLHSRRYTKRRSAADREPVCEEINGVEFEWLWSAPYSGNDYRRVFNWLTFSRSLLRYESVPLRSTELVIGSTPHLFAALAAHRIARRARVPFILEVRDLWPESLRVGGGPHGPGYWTLAGIAQFLYRSADRIIVLAEGVADYLVTRGIPASKISCIPNGVDMALFAGQPAAAPRDSLRLVYAGALGPANGLEVVINAARLVEKDPRVRFTFLGDGPARNSLIESARHFALTNVEFLAPIAKADMPAFLRSCDAGLMVLRDLPLFSFGVSPNKLFDYWGAALPVVCNVPGELARWLNVSHGGVQTTDSSAPSLADAIIALLELTPQERRAMGVRGRDWVSKERNRAVLAARLDRLLGEVLSN